VALSEAKGPTSLLTGARFSASWARNERAGSTDWMHGMMNER
jgi:hypothetical protein